MTAGPDKRRNIATALRLMNRAVRAGAKLIALPETFSHVAAPALMRAEAETPIDGATYTALAAFARQHGVAILAGSISTRLPAPARGIANRSVLFDRTGQITAHYDKIHLFDTRVARRVYRESDTFEAGSRPIAAPSPWGLLGLTICYDLRFPELFRALAFAGAQVIFVPAAFTDVTGRAHWLPLLRARAIENQAFVVAPGLCGRFENRAWHGHSCIIDPWGRLLAQAGSRESIVTADLDFRELKKIREAMPALRHARRDLFLK